MSRPGLAAALALALGCLSAPARAQSSAPLAPPPPPPVEMVPAAPLPPPPPPVLPPESVEPAARSGFSVKLGLGGTFRSLYGIPFGGGDLLLSLGGHTKGASFYADLGAFLGSTAFGLTTTDLSLGFGAEGRIGGRFRLGGGAGFGLLVIRRVTNDESIFDFTVGPRLQASFDLARFEESAVFLFFRGGLEWLLLATDGNDGLPLMASASLGVGWRY